MAKKDSKPKIIIIRKDLWESDKDCLKSLEAQTNPDKVLQQWVDLGYIKLENNVTPEQSE